MPQGTKGIQRLASIHLEPHTLHFSRLELSVCPARGQPWCMRHNQNSHVAGEQNFPWSSSDTYTWLPGLPAGFAGSICLWQLFPYTLQCASHFISLSLKKSCEECKHYKSGVISFLNTSQNLWESLGAFS